MRSRWYIRDNSNHTQEKGIYLLHRVGWRQRRDAGRRVKNDLDRHGPKSLAILTAWRGAIHQSCPSPGISVRIRLSFRPCEYSVCGIQVEEIICVEVRCLLSQRSGQPGHQGPCRILHSVCNKLFEGMEVLLRCGHNERDADWLILDFARHVKAVWSSFIRDDGSLSGMSPTFRLQKGAPVLL